jgi:hypothetical protein
MSHVYCPQCGFQSPETASFCSRCGAALVHPAVDETTLTLPPGELPDAELDVPGPALIVRAGGGRAGEAFTVDAARTLVGRSPDCDVFLDDVTVSRRHAEIFQAGDKLVIRDLGSLNGTFVNRRRIDEAELEDDDEVQIGKYRMTFLRR